MTLITAHPAEDSFNSSLAQAWQRGAQRSGAIVRRFDVNKLRFDPVLRGAYREKTVDEPDLAELRASFEASSHVTWVFPTWWVGMPAMLKGLIDRLFLPGWAFKFEGKALPTGFPATKSTELRQPRLHLRGLHEAGLFEHLLATLEDHEVGNAADLKAGRELWVRLGVDLEHHRFPGHLRGDQLHLGGRHSARAAPRRPKVDQHRDLRVLRDGVELSGVHVDRRVDGRQRGFAFPAVPRFVKVLRRNSVLLTAGWAGSDHGSPTVTMVPRRAHFFLPILAAAQTNPEPITA